MRSRKGMACHVAITAVSMQGNCAYELVHTGRILQHIIQSADDRGKKGPSVKPSTVSNVIPELLAERGWTADTLAQELGVSTSTIEKRLAPSFSLCVETLSNTCAPLGYQVMLVPVGTEVEGGYVITE